MDQQWTEIFDQEDHPPRNLRAEVFEDDFIMGGFEAVIEEGFLGVIEDFLVGGSESLSVWMELVCLLDVLVDVVDADLVIGRQIG